jgi:hypothetical protein
MTIIDNATFGIGDYVQLINHSEPTCNGMYGNITKINVVRGTTFYDVQLEDIPNSHCSATEDEIMEG